jgi:branched-chain amino acid transport system substrate-binding protein
VGGQAWPAVAKDFGYEIVENAGFPMESNQFTSVIGDAKASGADIMLVMSSTPQAVAIRKQMAAAGYAPKVIVMERGGEPQQFADALGPLSDGVLVGAYWDPSFPYPGAADLAKLFEEETGQTSSQHVASSYSVANIMLDAIARAASTDGDAINDELAKTDAIYAVGPVKFDEAHTSKLPIAEAQWQGERPVIVWPKEEATGELMFPVPASD